MLARGGERRRQSLAMGLHQAGLPGPAQRGRARGLYVAAGAVALLWAPPPPAATQSTPSPRVIAYLASWSVRRKGLRVADIRGDRLTHIFYAFGHLSAEGRAALGDGCLDAGECGPGGRGDAAQAAPGGNFAQLRRLKQRFPHLRVLISLGGWGGSRYFSDAAATPETRRTFAMSTIDLFFERFPGVFDGVDVDWEFPVAGGLPENRYRPEDKRNFTLLLAEFRRQLDRLGARQGRRLELTIAASARPAEIANLEASELSRLLDWINVMTYDYHSVDSVAHFNAPLFAVSGDPTPELNVDASMRVFLAAGVPPDRLVVGVPFYGRGYGGVAAERDGLLQRADPARARDWGTGGIDYRLLMGQDPERHGFKRFWHPEARVPWLYNPAARIWITFDDPRSVALKADYARARGFGGVMFWELGGDDGTLLAAIHEGLRPPVPRER